MIFTIILTIIYFVILGVINIAGATAGPLMVLLGPINSSISLFFDYLYGWNWLFPVDTLMLVLQALFTSIVFEFLWRAMIFMLSVVPMLRFQRTMRL